MHPLLARIHPALRSALVAWLSARLIVWGAPALTAAPPFVPTQHLPALTPTFGLWLAGELMLLWGAVSVYNFARRESLGPVAERATWLWALCPLMHLSALEPRWALAAGAAAVTLDAAHHARYKTALAGCALAMLCEPGFVVLWPALAWMGWRAFVPGRAPEWMRFALAGVPGVLFGLSMWHRGARFDEVRPVWPGEHLVATPGALAVCLATGVGLAVVLRYVRQIPAPWLLAALVCLAAPLAGLTSGIVLFALPVFVCLGRLCESAAWERPLLVGSAVALAVASLAAGV